MNTKTLTDVQADRVGIAADVRLTPDQLRSTARSLGEECTRLRRELIDAEAESQREIESLHAKLRWARADSVLITGVQAFICGSLGAAFGFVACGAAWLLAR